MDTKIFMIPTAQLEHHPMNPRKEIGDIEELTASIEANGILQNLTVVVAEDEKFWVVIGNRRLEAGKAAGLLSFPCVIAKMSEQEQLETMLVENMQRSDLTVLEQAEGFHQLTLTGLTAEDIADRTGFSKTTVNRRLKLTEYNSEKTREAFERGATLADFAKLEQIKSKKDRDELLGVIGTNNYNQKFNRILGEQMSKENTKRLRKLLKGKATEVDKNEWDYWNEYHSKFEKDSENNRIVIDDELFEGDGISLKGDHEHFYSFQHGWCFFLRRKKSKKETNNGKSVHSEQEKQWERNRRQLNKLAEQFYQLRKEFVESIQERKSFKNWQSICIEFLLKKTCCFYGAELKLDYDWQREKGITGTTQEELEKFQEYYNEHAAGLLIWLIYNSTYDSAEQRFHNNWQWQHPKGVQNTRLSFIYEFLCAFGYEMSDEEKLWQDGKHPLQK